MSRIFTGLMSRFDVYKDVSCRRVLGTGYRVMYEHKNTIMTNMTLIDSNGEELEDGFYHLVIHNDDDRLVVIPEDVQ